MTAIGYVRKEDDGRYTGSIRTKLLNNGHIAKIIDTYQFRKEEDRYSKRVPLDVIEANDFSLNISRYVSTTTANEEIDLATVNQELLKLEAKATETKDAHNNFLKERGLPLSPQLPKREHHCPTTEH